MGVLSCVVYGMFARFSFLVWYTKRMNSPRKGPSPCTVPPAKLLLFPASCCHFRRRRLRRRYGALHPTAPPPLSMAQDSSPDGLNRCWQRVSTKDMHHDSVCWDAETCEVVLGSHILRMCG